MTDTSDPLDVASINEQVNCDMKVKEIQALASKELPKSDICWGCGEPTKDGRRWHNVDCRKLWEDFGRQ